MTLWRHAAPLLRISNSFTKKRADIPVLPANNCYLQATSTKLKSKNFETGGIGWLRS
jgi:hypothetical protein